MTELHIRQLSPEAQDQIISGVTYAEQHGLLADISCIDQEFARLRSLGEIPTPQMRLNLGAALGYIIQQHTNMQWASVTDGTTSVVVLVGSPASNKSLFTRSTSSNAAGTIPNQTFSQTITTTLSPRYTQHAKTNPRQRQSPGANPTQAPARHGPEAGHTRSR